MRGTPRRRTCHRVGPCTPPSRGPRRQKRRGPRVTGQKHHLPTGTSVCRIRTSRIGLRRVRGSRKRDRRPPLVRWKLRCPRRAMNLPAAGDPTVYGPPFPLTSLNSCLLLSAGVRAPRDFMAPNTCDGTYCGGARTAEHGRGAVGSAPSPRAGGSSAFLTILALSTRETLASAGQHVYQPGHRFPRTSDGEFGPR
jgi:hypothetical protein